MYSSEIKQYKSVYQSTIEFDKFIKKKLLKSKFILDAGCGEGGTLSFYAKKYKNLKIIGLDYRRYNIVTSRKYFKKFNLDTNTKFKKINLLKKINDKDLKNPDGIISEKTFCTFKNIESVLNNLINLNPKWIAINSLFFDGNLDVFIHTRNTSNKKYLKSQDKNPDSDFNIFSIDNLKKFLKRKNYRVSKIKPFFPLKKIKKIKSNRGRGTYTIKTEINKFTCFSGPVYLPWHFILIEKS